MIVRQITPISSNGFATSPIDLEIKEGRIARLGQKLENPQGLKEFFYKGALISWGWVDLHVHVFLELLISQSVLNRQVREQE